MKNLLIILITIFTIISCNRSDFEADDFPQEEITNILLNVKDVATNSTKTYNYSVGGTLPEITLSDAKIYEVSIVYMNGNTNITQDIINAKDEHFITFNFPNSEVALARNDDEIRSDGKKVGLKSTWNVVKLIKTGSSAEVKISLIHASISVDENQQGTTWGSTNGGETDAEAIFMIKNG